jgi:integrase
VFTGNHGTHVDPQALNRLSTPRRGQAGVRHLTVHDARRACAALLVDVEVRPRVIRRIRRQADVSRTLEIDLNARADGAARRAGAQVGGAPSSARFGTFLQRPLRPS